MKKALPLLLLLFFAANAYCQRVHFVKFIYEGDQTKPIYPLIISVEKMIAPTDRLDKNFALGFKTDINTFNCIRNFVRISRYTVLYKINSLNDRFKIVCSDGRIYYLYGGHIGAFSIQLQSILKEKKLDKRVIDIFNIY